MSLSMCLFWRIPAITFFAYFCTVNHFLFLTCRTSYIFCIHALCWIQLSQNILNTRDLPSFLLMLNLAKRVPLLMHNSPFPSVISSLFYIWEVVLPIPISWRYSPLCNSRSFVTLPFTSRFTVHHMIWFMQARSGSTRILSICIWNWPEPTLCWKDTFCPLQNHPFHKPVISFLDSFYSMVCLSIHVLCFDVKPKNSFLILSPKGFIPWLFSRLYSLAPIKKGHVVHCESGFV